MEATQGHARPRMSTLLLWQGSSLSQSSCDWWTGWPTMDRSLSSHSACLPCKTACLSLDHQYDRAHLYLIQQVFSEVSRSPSEKCFLPPDRHSFLIANGNQLCKQFMWLSWLQRNCPVVKHGPPPPSSLLLHTAVYVPQQTTVCMLGCIPHGPPAANFGRRRYLKICIYI